MLVTCGIWRAEGAFPSLCVCGLICRKHCAIEKQLCLKIVLSSFLLKPHALISCICLHPIWEFPEYTLKSSILMVGFSLINHSFWVSPFMETSIYPTHPCRSISPRCWYFHSCRGVSLKMTVGNTILMAGQI